MHEVVTHPMLNIIVAKLVNLLYLEQQIADVRDMKNQNSIIRKKFQNRKHDLRHRARVEP